MLIKLIGDVLALLQAMVILILAHEAPGAEGSSKKASVVADITALLADFPATSFLRLVPSSVMTFVVGFAVDQIVAAANKAGFFASGKTVVSASATSLPDGNSPTQTTAP